MIALALRRAADALSLLADACARLAERLQPSIAESNVELVSALRIERARELERANYPVLSFEGGGRVSVRVEDIMSSPRFHQQLNAVRELEAEAFRQQTLCRGNLRIIGGAK